MAPRLDRDTGGLSSSQFLRHYRDLRAARTPMEQAVAVYRNVLKRLKGDGVDTWAVGVLEKLVKVEEEQAGLHIRNLFRYAGWTGANIGVTQGDLFTGGEAEQPDEESTLLFREQLAEEHGAKAGVAGEKFDTNPHGAGDALHAAWARGWHRGQADAVTRSFGKAPKPPKQPTRRGRRSAESDALDDAMKSLDDPDPASVQESDKPQDGDTNVRAFQPRPRGTRSDPDDVRARKSRLAAKAADSPIGDPAVTSSTAF